MTREEAISIIERVEHTESKWPGTEDTLEALDMAIAALRAQQQTEANEPMTLDELRQMEGEPVWIVWADGRIKAQWWIVGNYDWHMMEFDDRYDYGKAWIAYRHKRKEAHHGSN